MPLLGVDIVCGQAYAFQLVVFVGILGGFTHNLPPLPRERIVPLLAPGRVAVGRYPDESAETFTRRGSLRTPTQEQMVYVPGL